MQGHPVRTAGGLGGPKYQRHQPEKTLLYQIIVQHYSTLQAGGVPFVGQTSLLGCASQNR